MLVCRHQSTSAQRSRLTYRMLAGTIVAGLPVEGMVEVIGVYLGLMREIVEEVENIVCERR